MPEDQKSGFSEAVETGASAAHTIWRSKMLIPAGLFITPTCLFLSIVQPKTRILKAFL